MKNDNSLKRNGKIDVRINKILNKQKPVNNLFMGFFVLFKVKMKVNRLT